MIRVIAAAALLAVGSAARPAHASQPDLASTEQRLEWLQTPQNQGDWANTLARIDHRLKRTACSESW